MANPAPSKFPKTVEEKIAYALGLKAEGNAFFGQQDYPKAIARYTKIFAFVTGLSEPAEAKFLRTKGAGAQDSSNVPPNTSQSTEINDLLLAANSNLAQCYLKLGQGDKALRFAKQALDIDPRNVKALFRRGQAQALLNNDDAAIQDFQNALTMSPGDVAIKAALAASEKKVKELERKANASFKGMFDRLT